MPTAAAESGIAAAIGQHANRLADDDNFDLVKDILIEDERWKQRKDGEDTDEKETGLLNLDEPEPKPKRKRKSKYKELRRIFIFDDLSNEIRKSKSLKALLKANRHYFYKTIVSTQWLNDLEPDCISQMDYTLLFKDHNKQKLEELYFKLDLSIPLKSFWRIYKLCTKHKDQFNFLYISRTGEIRCNFDKLLIIEDKNSDI